GRVVQREADGRAAKGVAGRVGGRRLHRVGAVGLRGPGGQGGAAGPGRRRAAGGGAVAGRQVEGGGLPARAGPVVVVRGALQREGGAVGGQPRAARVVGHAAAEAGRHGGRPEGAAAGRGGGRGRGRGGPVQGEADGGAGEGITVLVGRGRLHRVGAVALGGPGR